MIHAADREPQEVRIDPPGVGAFLGVPAVAKAAVLFAHGSGSGRHSPRNAHVAGKLREAGIATLLLDLLTPDEELDRGNVFDIALLAERLSIATDWVESHPALHGLPLGYFGASTGAGAALLAAAWRDDAAAVVSRGGRPDLAMDALDQVRAPTLLIVGGRDVAVIEMNRVAQAHLRAESQLVIVPGATHLFEEPGALDEVIRLARDWFLRWFGLGAGLSAPEHRPPAGRG
jgi:pimeloyl-ACP methyl ester carboxylesterase